MVVQEVKPRRVLVIGDDEASVSRLQKDVIKTGDVNVTCFKVADIVFLDNPHGGVASVGLFRGWGFLGEIVVALDGQGKTERDFDMYRDAGASVVVH